MTTNTSFLFYKLCKILPDHKKQTSNYSTKAYSKKKQHFTNKNITLETTLIYLGKTFFIFKKQFTRLSPFQMTNKTLCTVVKK